MNKAELVQALAAAGPVKREQDAEAVIDALASIIWHELERGEEVEYPRVGRFGVTPAARGRAVAFEPATELEVAVNRHHITA